MTIDSLATGLAANRILFGLGFLAAPERASKSWIGPVAGEAGARVMVRAAGARDLALGTGALVALRSGRGDARAWFLAQAVSDGSDLLATWVARRDLGPARTAYAVLVAGASTAIAAAYAARGDVVSTA